MGIMSAPRQPLPFQREMNFAYGELQEVAPGVRRFVCQNPSPFTFKGTNAYVLGQGEVGLVDPGPADEGHGEALLAALARAGDRVSHILLTHCHADHSGAVDFMRKRTGAPAFGFARANGAAFPDARHSPSGRSFIIPVDFDQRLADGDSVEGQGWAVTALHTPGHAPDHLCFALRGEPLLFSGDHVMGWNTSVVAPPEGHMGAYIRSLEKLLRGEQNLFLPGHGGPIEQPQRLVKAFIMHRRWREAEIAECLRSGIETIDLIVPKIYGRLDSALSGAAALAVFAQIELMMEKGLVRTANCQPASLESRFALMR
jgi:glyoxylase-like metal-dependent hydrolase (beta-lactamase superfamily II)